MQRSDGAARIELLKPRPQWWRAFKGSAAFGVSAKDLGCDQHDANCETKPPKTRSITFQSSIE
jgi:hypothetical protein